MNIFSKNRQLQSKKCNHDYIFPFIFSIFNKAFILQTYLYENVHKTRAPAHLVDIFILL